MSFSFRQTSKSSLTRASLIIAFFSLLSRLVGLLRDRVFASTFGAGDTLDVYYAAFRVPDFLFNLLILGTLSAAFIPVFTEYLLRDESQAWKIANSILNLTLLVMSVLSAVLAIFAPLLVSLIVPGFEDEKQIQTITLTRIMLLSPLFFSLSSIFSSVLNSYRRFTVVAALPVLYNLSIIAGVLIFYPMLGIKGLAWGVVLGALLHMLTQIPQAYRLGFRWRWSMTLGLPGVRKIAKLFLPRVFGLDLSPFVSAIIGSHLAAGGIAVYSLANNLQAVPIGVIAISFAVVAFPSLSEAVAKGDRRSFRELFNINISQILYLMIPLSVLMLVLRAQIVRLILGAGQFDWEDTIRTISALGFFALSIFAQALIPLFARAFYSLHNTVIPVISGLVAAGVNVAAALLLVPRFEVAGLALAFSCGAIVNFLFLFFLLEIKFGNLVNRELVFKLEKIIASTIMMGTVTYASLFVTAPRVDTHTGVGLLVQTAVALSLGLGTYLGLTYLLNVGESRHMVVTGKLWLNKLRTAFARFPGL